MTTPLGYIRRNVWRSGFASNTLSVTFKGSVQPFTAVSPGSFGLRVFELPTTSTLDERLAAMGRSASGSINGSYRDLSSVSVCRLPAFVFAHLAKLRVKHQIAKR